MPLTPTSVALGSDSSSAARALAALSVTEGFTAFPDHVLREFAGEMKEESFAAGAVIVEEGEMGDRLYVIAAGKAEASAKNREGTLLPVAILEPGETFGKLALLHECSPVQVTVRTLGPMQVFSLGRARFHQILDQHPEMTLVFAEIEDRLLAAKFLKQTSPFATVDPVALEKLVVKFIRKTVPAGEMIICQGDVAESAYFLRSGQVEVLLRDGQGVDRRIATLTPGTMFGEAALLTTAPRNASVRALEPCELLGLRREELLEAMGGDKATGRRVMELLHMRDRPRRVDGVEAVHRTDPEGETITVLKDPVGGTYYRLSPQGWFIWQRLDGCHTLRDLTLEYFVAFKALAPHAVAEVIGGLTASGFVKTRALRPDVSGEALSALTVGQRLSGLARRILEFRVSLGGVDGFLGRVYQGGVRHLFTRTGYVLLGTLAIVGIIAFSLHSGPLARLGTVLGPGGLLVSVLASYAVIIAVHEAGHAFATKSFGRQVPRVGLGWYWFGPIAFVDTSDMWLEERWPRIVVNLAGIHANLALAGITSLAAWFCSDPWYAALLLQFSLLSYLLVIFNLNPLLEYDGYFVLMDWLDRPNLRVRSLSWLGQDFGPSLRRRGGLRGHWIEVCYGLGSILYIGAMAVLTVVLYRLFAQDAMARLTNPALAAALGWMLAGLVLLLCVTMVAGELKGKR